MDIQTTTVTDGRGHAQEVPMLVPNFNTVLALVDLGVIQRLAALLPKANFATIRQELAEGVANAKDLDHMLQIIEEELAFHKSVNIITTYDPRKPQYPNH